MWEQQRSCHEARAPSAHALRVPQAAPTATLSAPLHRNVRAGGNPRPGIEIDERCTSRRPPRWKTRSSTSSFFRRSTASAWSTWSLPCASSWRGSSVIWRRWSTAPPRSGRPSCRRSTRSATASVASGAWCRTMAYATRRSCVPRTRPCSPKSWPSLCGSARAVRSTRRCARCASDPNGRRWTRRAAVSSTRSFVTPSSPASGSRVLRASASTPFRPSGRAVSPASRTTCSTPRRRSP